jgi:membrane fusion protein (multidrug efflux system)
MASKPLYTVVAVVGIASASGAAWWYQNRPTGAPVEGAVVAASAPGPRGASAPAAGPSGPARPPGVEVAKVEATRLVDDTQAVGALRSRQGVMVRPEVSGRVTRINFRDGERVQRGQLMVQLDDDLPRAQVAQARAELSIAAANHKRNQDLVAQNFISQRSVDESAAALQVAQAKLALAQAQADRLRIVAPFDGTVGLRNINVGDYLKDGTDIVNLEDLEAILVDFRLPERFQAKLRKGQMAMVTVDALPGAKFPAVVQAIDPLVDANGRSVGVRACIDNRQQRLRPGMFARVTAVFGERESALVIPEEAIVPQGARQFVFKIVPGAEPDSRISQRTEVKVGLRLPGRVEIVEGLKAGDVVVTAGQQRLQRDGITVRVIDVPRGGPAAAGGGAPGAAAAASGAASAAPMASAALARPASAPAATGARAAARAPAGPNPCLQALEPAAPRSAS